MSRRRWPSLAQGKTGDNSDRSDRSDRSGPKTTFRTFCRHCPFCPIYTCFLNSVSVIFYISIPVTKVTMVTEDFRRKAEKNPARLAASYARARPLRWRCQRCIRPLRTGPQLAVNGRVLGGGFPSEAWNHQRAAVETMATNRRIARAQIVLLRVRFVVRTTDI